MKHQASGEPIVAPQFVCGVVDPVFGEALRVPLDQLVLAAAPGVGGQALAQEIAQVVGAPALRGDLPVQRRHAVDRRRRRRRTAGRAASRRAERCAAAARALRRTTAPTTGNRSPKARNAGDRSAPTPSMKRGQAASKLPAKSAGNGGVAEGLQPRQRREAVALPPVGVVAGDGVDDGLGVRGGAPHDLVGDTEPAKILEHEDEVVCRLVEGGEVRTRRRQRVGEADLLVEAHLAQVELEVLADGRPDLGVEHRELHDHRRRHVRVHPRDAPGTSGRASPTPMPICSSRHSRTSAPRTSLSHAGRHRQGIDREHCHPPRPSCE